MKPFKFNTPEVIKRKIRSIAVQLSPSFDGGILANILKMIYYHGVKIEEFQIMKIGYVVGGGKIFYRLESIYPPYLSLGYDYKILIQWHLDYLKENLYSVKKDAPLFPKIKSTGHKDESSPYQDYEIGRQLKKRAGITWEQLRRDRVYHHYLLLVWQGYSNQDIINLAAWYFRENKKEIYNILKQGGIKLPGIKKERAVKAPAIKPSSVEPIKQTIGGGKGASFRENSTNIFDLRNVENENPFKDFDDEDAEDDYWKDDED
jgi:hypothetical protein